MAKVMSGVWVVGTGGIDCDAAEVRSREGWLDEDRAGSGCHQECGVKGARVTKKRFGVVRVNGLIRLL